MHITRFMLQMQTLMLMAQYVDDEYITTKGLTLMGDRDMAEEILKRKAAEEVGRFDGDEPDSKRKRTGEVPSPS